ncbi:PIR protein [Plasmodium yoelii]|uniref:PIR protein n=2 Tax=Plasmodium yoelii TaxID=5861 RepID=A0AAE9WRF8_PLAYO|nr:PIR protein [Plasmodium yoelii]WBY55219.1 PIR protein [Plasmodium yoelii yoelii]CDU16404.1 YIR protein [Plasmodium yoelii]VTZ73148.1 PIR protein [Plasmodium yoelii]|eukprot:XP_022811523.1 PIR protein [Plasmodium yoelii]
MDYKLCGRFDHLRLFYSDELGKSAGRDIHSLGSINSYCSNEVPKDKNCNTDIDKIKGAFLWLFEQSIIINIDSLSKDKSGAFIIYIMIWLSYMLKIKNVNTFKNINEFYKEHIKDNTHYTNNKKCGDDCNSILKNKLEYNNFNEFIEANEYLMNIDIKDISNFYAPIKLLCKMHTGCNAQKSNCTECLQIANEFVETYEKLYNDYNNNENKSYSKVLSILSNDYDNLKNKCNDVNFKDISSLRAIKTKENGVQSSEHSSEVTSSSSSVTNKLFIVLSIFGAIAFFLGIAYKYSLFGFRKRTQKQHLRKNLKK